METTLMEKISLVLEQIALLVVVSIMIERALTFLFDARPIRDFVTGNGRFRMAKPWIALLTSGAIVFSYKLDLLKTMYQDPSSDPTLAGLALTSLMLAGGSAGMITLFHDVLGWSKDAREESRRRRDTRVSKIPGTPAILKQSSSAGQFGL
jgi:hypothetical protein